jgi:hypothetical protein
MNISRSKEFAARRDMFRRSKRSASVVAHTNRIGSAKPVEKRDFFARRKAPFKRTLSISFQVIVWSSFSRPGSRAQAAIPRCA